MRLKRPALDPEAVVFEFPEPLSLPAVQYGVTTELQLSRRREAGGEQEAMGDRNGFKIEKNNLWAGFGIDRHFGDIEFDIVSRRKRKRRR